MSGNGVPPRRLDIPYMLGASKRIRLTIQGEQKMTKPALTLMVHGVYALISGLTLVLLPAPILRLLGFDTTPNAWVRVFGLEVAVLGFYYLVSVSRNLTPIIRASIVGRLFFTIVLAMMALCDVAGWNLVLLGAVDVVGAFWTLLALRARSLGQPEG